MNNNIEKTAIVEPDFGSNLMELILALDYLRKKVFTGSTPDKIFSQLKHLFHMLESIGSARIEGNNTTVAEYIETKVHGALQLPDMTSGTLEIYNIEKAMEYIESDLNNLVINRKFISELHQIVTHDLQFPPDGEGDENAGNYRNKNVAIHKSCHIPPDMVTVPGYMDDLFNFINNLDKPQYDLLKIAIAHHRFVWIHPFNNGRDKEELIHNYH